MKQNKQAYVGKLFIMLSDDPKKSTDAFLRRVDRFLWRLGVVTKTHPHSYIGYERYPSLHGHVGIFVPESESKRFDERIHQFEEWNAWKFNKFEMQPWDEDKAKDGKTHSYILEKHRPVNLKIGAGVFDPIVHCPKKYHQCKNENCSYQHSQEYPFKHTL